jgi:hypothetical protein
MANKIGFLKYSDFSGGLQNIKEEVNEILGGSVGVILGETSPMTRAISEGTRIIGKRLIISWGNSLILPSRDNVMLRNSIRKTTYTNKLDFFSAFTETTVSPFLPMFFTDALEAANYVQSTTGGRRADSPILVERQILSGSGGEGISLIRQAGQINSSSRLWVVYKKKRNEYRVHFYKRTDGIVSLFVQKKLLKRDSAPPRGQTEDQYKVRNLENGWVYSPNCTDYPVHILRAAAEMAACSNLHFGAIDIVHNDASNSSWILEVNTAPGAVESTAKWYARNIVDDFNNFVAGAATHPPVTGDTVFSAKRGNSEETYTLTALRNI